MDGTRETGNRSDNWLPFVAAEVSIHVQEFRATGATTFGAVHGGTNTLSNLMFRAEAGVASPVVDHTGLFVGEADDRCADVRSSA